VDERGEGDRAAREVQERAAADRQHHLDAEMPHLEAQEPADRHLRREQGEVRRRGLAEGQHPPEDALLGRFDPGERPALAPAARPEGVPMASPTVCLSFDWDGVSVWMAGGATDARSLSRGEFGPRVGVPRLLALCDRLGIIATFFTPGHTADTYPETAASIAAAGHEVAAHGYAHEDFEQLSLDEARHVIRRAADAIERAVGRRPRGMRFPPWAVAGEHFQLLLDEGYTYSSSLMDDVRPH